MGDIYVHERMQRCCRDELTRLDEVRTKVSTTGASLLPLAEKTAEAAIGLLPPPKGCGSVSTGDPIEPLADMLRDSSAKASQRHAHLHAERSEKAEAMFWARLAETF